MPTQKLPLPIRGVNRSVTPSRFPEGYALDAKNVIPFDATEGRARGGQRAGTSRAIEDQVNGLNRVQGLKQITLAEGAASGIDFTNDDPYADLDPDDGGGLALPDPDPLPDWPSFGDLPVSYPDFPESNSTPIINDSWIAGQPFVSSEWVAVSSAAGSPVTGANGLYAYPSFTGGSSFEQSFAVWRGSTPGPNYNATLGGVRISQLYFVTGDLSYNVDSVALLWGKNPAAYEGRSMNDIVHPSFYFNPPLGAAFRVIWGASGEIVVSRPNEPDIAYTTLGFSSAFGVGVNSAPIPASSDTGYWTQPFDMTVEVRRGVDVTYYINGVQLPAATSNAARFGNSFGFHVGDWSQKAGSGANNDTVGGWTPFAQSFTVTPV